MRIQLTVSEPNIPGYFWASPQNTELKNPDQFYNIWEYCMEGQATEIYAPSILEIFKVTDLEQIIPEWAKLLAGGGKLILGGTDFYILAREGIRRAKDLGMLNEILFNKPHSIQSLTSVESTRKFLESLNFGINKINIDHENFGYTVEGIKND